MSLCVSADRSVFSYHLVHGEAVGFGFMTVIVIKYHSVLLCFFTLHSVLILMLP